MTRLLRDLRLIVPISLGLGLILSLLGPGTWWIGWLAYAFVLTIGLLALTALWRSAGGVRRLGLMLILAVVIRLGLGMSFSTILPVFGNDTPVYKAGFPVRDASTYDAQAWKLASSSEPLWRAFDRSYGADDQYGGLLFFHSLVYRYLSPDAHRPWLLMLLSALAGALGVALAWKGVRLSWGEPVAWGVGWIMALYPESLLVGSAPVRESFLILFTAMAFWGVVDWQENRHQAAWFWLGGSLLGMALFSPGVIVATLGVLGVWVWLREKERRISRWWFVAGLGVILLAFVFMGVIVGGTLIAPGGPLVDVFNWLHFAFQYNANLTVDKSGWIQTIFASLPASLHLPFIVLYGVAQPVLPAAIADPAVWPMRALGILRGLGWYALLPLLLYGLRPIWKMTEKRERLTWLWLWLTTWSWIFISAMRAGGDQWNNPRYRVILLLFQAALAAQALVWARQTGDRWLGRVLASEGVFLILFGYWYVARYSNWKSGQVHIFIIFTAIIVVVAAIFIYGFVSDHNAKAGRGRLER